MEEILIANHNNLVGKNDITYHLGHFSFSDPAKIIKRLNGNLVLIRGNHDHRRNVKLDCFASVHDVKFMKIGKDRIFLSHYAHLVWPNSHHGAYHLFGHSHGKLQGGLNSIDCGVDCHDFTPVSWEDLKNVMDNEMK